MEFYELIGFVGVAFYLGSYGALQLGFMRGQGYPYALCNLAGASCVLISLTEAFNLSSALIQVFWIAISLIGIVRFYLLSQYLKFSDEEQEFLRLALPGLSKLKARKLLDMGEWISAETGGELTHEGQPVDNLIFLSTGEAVVKSNGTQVAVCENNTFVGELTALSGENATASVTLSAPSRYLAIPAEKLRTYLNRDDETRTHLERCFAGQVLHKLKMTNTALAAQQATA